MPTRLWFVAVLLCLTGAAVRAQQPGGPARLNARAGLAGVARQGRIGPVIVDVDAGSARGPHTVRYVSNDRTASQSIELTPGAVKRIELLTDNFGGSKVELLDASGEVVDTAAMPNAESFSDEQMLALVVARPESHRGPATLDRLMLDRGPQLDPVRVEVRHLAAAGVPDHWVGLDAVDLVVVGDDDLERAPQARLAALVDWTARGGTLVVSGGVRPARLAGTPLAAALPVELSGRTRTLSTLTALEAAFPSSVLARPPAPGMPAEAHPGLLVREPFLVPEANLRPGSRAYVTEHAPEGPVPLLARRTLGDGCVWYLALDLERSPFAYTGTATQLQLWRALAPRPVKQQHPIFQDWGRNGNWELGEGRVRADRAARLCALDPTSGGTAWVVAGFVLLYWILVGPLQYAILRRRGALHRVWAATPLLALGFSVLAFGLGYARRGGAAVSREMSVRRAHAGDPVSAVDGLARLHAFRERPYTARAGPGTSLALPYRSENGEVITFRRDGPALCAADVTVPMWADRLFWFAGTAGPPPAVDADLKVVYDGKGAEVDVPTVSGTLTWRGERRLTQARLVIDHYSVSIGELTPGQPLRITEQLSDKTDSRDYRWAQRRLPGRIQDLTQLDRSTQWWMALGGRSPDRRLMLVGLAEPALELGFLPPVTSSDRREVIALTLPHGQQSGRFRMQPFGYVRWRTDAQASLDLSGPPPTAPLRCQVRLFSFPRRSFSLSELQIVTRRNERPPLTIRMKSLSREAWDTVFSPSTSSGSSHGYNYEPVEKFAVPRAADYVQMPEGLIEMELVPTGTLAPNALARLGFELGGVETDPEAVP